MLPDISIKVDIEPREFIDRLEHLAKQFEDIHIARTFDVGGFEGWHCVNLEPRASIHEKLCGGIFSKPESDSRVFIEMSAKQWNPDPPDYDTYTGAARSLFIPLIKAYNKEHHSRYRLNIQVNSIKEPALPPITAKRLTSFIVCANKSALHPNDWKRFYQFIAFCHTYHVKLSEGRLRYLLAKDGFSTEKAEYLADIYCHGREILSLRR